MKALVYCIMISFNDDRILYLYKDCDLPRPDEQDQAMFMYNFPCNRKLVQELFRSFLLYQLQLDLPQLSTMHAVQPSKRTHLQKVELLLDR